MKILIPSDKNWKKSMVFGIISLTFFVSTIVYSQPTPGYAPHMFAYNIGFFFPVMLTSLIFLIIALIFYFKIGKGVRKELNKLYSYLPLIILIPPFYQIMIIAINFFIILID